jgi:phosphatidylglycerophosphatase A
MNSFLRINRWLAIWFGCGLSPKAPGTVGTLGAIPLFLLLVRLESLHYMAAVLAFSVASILVAHFYELGGEEHDRPEFVMDEVAGFLVTMTWVPATVPGVIAGFAIFRLLDIVKPFPISWVDQKIPGGVGTVADDLVAGILGNVILQLLLQNGVTL